MSKQLKGLYEFGPFRLDIAERLLLRQGKPIPLPSTAFDVLCVLVERRGHLVGKDELIEDVWPDTVVEESNLTVNISTLRTALRDDPKAPRFIETVPKHGYRFVAKVRELASNGVDEEVARPPHACLNNQAEAGVLDVHAVAEPAQVSKNLSEISTIDPVVPQRKLEPAGGAVPLSSEFYIVRPTDHEFQSAVSRRDSIVLVKGARQVGKTSLLARGLHQARQSGAKIILTDFQNLNAAFLESIEKLLLTLAESIADQLDLDISPTGMWLPHLSPGINFERYLRREVFVKISSPMVWGLDEVDRLFTCDFGGEIFGLFRSWHNKRALDPTGAWHRLTLAIAYATEAHLFITDLNQSPFNVGTRLWLEDFTLEEVAELNRRYDSPLRDTEELARYFRLVGGQPYLAHRGLYEMAAHGLSLASLEAQADHDEGIFGDHLRRILISLKQDGELCAALRGVLQGQPCPTSESFYRLRSAGIIRGDAASDVKLRCGLYAMYLRKHL